MEQDFEYMPGDYVPVKMWTKGVSVEHGALSQVRNIAALPFIHKHVAIMPDCHFGMGATVGSVIPTRGAIIPAAVGVDIGCGMLAAMTDLRAADLPDTLLPMRTAIERAIPHGRTDNGGKGDRGAWHDVPEIAGSLMQPLAERLQGLLAKHPKIAGRHATNPARHLGTLGTGNHFVEVCLDQDQRVWVMLHSGSRGIGNAIGRYFIEKAKEEMRRWFISLPDSDLAYFPEGNPLFQDYLDAVHWAQEFALANRSAMMLAAIGAIEVTLGRPVAWGDTAVNCHHNYVAQENHFGANVWVTRKGAVRARVGDLGIIPGSMGAKSYIVRGKGHPESFCSCSHGAGRAMSRTEARRRFSVEDHVKATEGVECRKDSDVIDETPGAYKSIDAVMAAQDSLVDIVHTLRAVLCVKG